MKKILTLLLSVCMVTLLSCKKDDTNTPNSLNGTTWEMTSSSFTSTFVFSETTVKNTYKNSNGSPSEINGTYTYTAPNITITFNTGTAVGVVEGNQMTLTPPEGAGDKIILIRK